VLKFKKRGVFAKWVISEDSISAGRLGTVLRLRSGLHADGAFLI